MNTPASASPTRFRLVLTLLILLPGIGRASDASPQSEVLVLSAFEVSAKNTANSRYGVGESTSGGRVRTDILDTPASIDVIPAQLLRDIGAGRMLDAAKYSSGVTEGNLPSSLERVTIRGFQSDGATVDGFYMVNQGQSNFDPAMIERLEVVKGPNAILSPNGPPGGTINVVTKRPRFTADASVTLQADLFGERRMETDLTGPVAGHPTIAYRLITASEVSDGWYDHYYKNSFLLAPSVTFRFGTASQLTFVGEVYRSQVNDYTGLVVDPTVGTNDSYRPWAGLSRHFNLAERDEPRFDRIDSLSAFFTTRAGEHLSVRIAGRAMYNFGRLVGFNTGLSPAGGRYDPLTGLYVGGTVFGAAPAYAPSPAPQPSRLVSRQGFWQRQYLSRFNLQNDYAWEQTFGRVNTLTTAGLAYSYISTRLIRGNASRGTTDVDNPTYGQLQVLLPAGLRTLAKADDYQFYLQERLGFLNDRLLLGGGVVPYRTKPDFTNLINGVNVRASAKAQPKNYGVLLKPLSGVSVYYSYAESAVPNSDTAALSAGTAPAFAVGSQREFGLKVQLLDQRLTASLVHYDIAQTNQPVPNPANNAVPPPPVALPPLYLSRTAKGWELQFTAVVTKNLEVIGNFSDGKNRDANNVPNRAAADRSMAALVRYQFTDGRLAGLAFNLGVDYLSRRAGDLVSGYAAASTPTNVIPLQPSFYLPARTLVNAAVTYDRGPWSYQLNVDNLLNTDYAAAALNRANVVAGLPLGLKLTVGRHF